MASFVGYFGPLRAMPNGGDPDRFAFDKVEEAVRPDDDFSVTDASELGNKPA